MQMFNGFTMRFLRSYSVNYDDHSVDTGIKIEDENKGQGRQENDETLANVKKSFEDGKIDANDVAKLANIVESNIFGPFKNRLDGNNSVKQSLIETIKDLIKNNNGEDKENLEEIVNKLGLKLNQENSEGESKEAQELLLKGKIDDNLVSLNEGEKPKYYRTIDKNEVDAEGKEVENSSEISVALTNINDQINEIDKLTSDANKARLPNGNKLGDVKEILKKFKHIIGNTTPENVKILQEYIYDNLDEKEQGIFKEENRWNKQNGFDGKFGSSTLEGLNGLLEKTKNYISQFENKKDEKKEEKKKDNTGLPVDTSNTGGNGSGKKQEAVPGIEEDSGATVETLQPVSTEPLTLSDNGGEDRTYLVMENSQQLAQNMGLSGVTFYSAEAFDDKLPADGGQAGTGGGSEETMQYPSAKPNDSGDYECYVKIDSPNDNRILKLKFDKNGDVCPVMKVAGQNEGGILLKNNNSCMRYLHEKLPNSVKKDCVIGWDSYEGDYEIISHDTRLTIEPMTIAGDWVVDKNNNDNKNDHLNKSLALLNFTNMLRSGGSINGKKLRGTDPDIKLDGDELYVQVEKYTNSGEKWYKINKAQFGLEGIKKPDLKRFKKYNNHEDWWDDYDRRPNVGYQKIDAIPVAPSVKAENKSAQKPTQTAVTAVTDAGNKVQVVATPDAPATSATNENNDQVTAAPDAVDTAAVAGNNAAPADNNAAKSEVKDGEGDNAGNKDQVAAAPAAKTAVTDGDAAVTGANPAVTENLNATDATKPDKQYDIKDIPLKQGDFENMNKDLGGKNFLSIQGNKVILDKQKLVDFLNNDVVKNFKKYRNLSKGPERTVGTGKRRALHSAVQIILNLLGEKLQINIDGKWTKGKDYYKAIKDFQKSKNLTEDGIPGPKTIDALIKAYNEKIGKNGEKDDEARENGKIENAGDLGLSEFKKVNKKDLNIPDSATVYNKAEDLNRLYYKEGNNIVRVSADEPWIKKSTSLSIQQNLDSSDNWPSSVNVCIAGTNKIVNVLHDDCGLKDFTLNYVGEHYHLHTKDGRYDISIDDILLKEDFCGKKNIGDKLKIFLWAHDNKESWDKLVQIDQVRESTFLADGSEFSLDMKQLEDIGVTNENWQDVVSYIKEIKDRNLGDEVPNNDVVYTENGNEINR